jgi:dynactin 1
LQFLKKSQTLFFLIRQRRREDDFRRTVGNYKRTVDTLRQEKQVLLELQQGGEGEKNNLVASSQKALSRAAQLVSETVTIRKREALAVVDHTNRIMYQQMSNRFESLLPQSVVSVELVTIKGEITASKVCCLASHLLSGINGIFRKSIRPSLPDTSITAEAVSSAEMHINISDEAQQEVLTIFHQVDFAHTIAAASAEIIRLIAAGQWPDFLSIEASTELGTIMGHSILELDETFGVLLRTLKEEGSLAIEQSSVGALKLTVQNTMHALRADIEQDDKILVKSDWNPPGWTLFRDVTIAKFICLGTASALSHVVDSNTAPQNTQTSMNKLYTIVEQSASLASNATTQLYNLDLLDDQQIGILSKQCSDFLSESMSLLSLIRELLTSNGSCDIASCNASGGNALRLISKLSMDLRSKNMNISDGEMYHPLSPEADDPWGGITTLVRSIRSIDGDSDDINFLLRSKAMEQRLGDAIENEPKLEWATSRITSLEKVRTITYFFSLFSRSFIYLLNDKFFYSLCLLARKNLLYKMPDYRNWKNLWRSLVLLR